MESASKQASTPVRSWNSRVERRNLLGVYHYAELNAGVQRAIVEAEKPKDFKKKNQFLDLLKDL